MGVWIWELGAEIDFAVIENKRGCSILQPPHPAEKSR